MPKPCTLAAGVIALALAGGCKQPGPRLSIGVHGDAPTSAAHLRVARTSGDHLVAAGDVDGDGRFTTTATGTYWARSTGASGTGELVHVAFTGRPLAVTAEVRTPEPDAARTVERRFQPGTSLVLDARDAAGLTYRLLVPADAFAAATVLTLTPLTHPLLANAAGDGLELRTTAPSRRPLYLEVIGGAADTVLVTYDRGRGSWRPQPGTVDDDGVRLHQLATAGRAIYSEVGPIPAQPPPSVTRGAVPVDEAAYARLSGDVRAALDWLSHRHPDGGALDDDEQAIIDMAADAMQSLATELADRACMDGPDIGGLQLAATALRSAQLLGAPSDRNDRLFTMVKRCVSQLLRATDCRAARTGGDVVAIELARQQLAQAARVVAGVGDDELARDLAGELADLRTACTPGGCDGGADLHQPPVSPHGLEPIAVDHCDAGCGQLCSITSSEDICHDEVDQGPRWNLEQCRGACEYFKACGFQMRIGPAPAGRCEYVCACRGGPLASIPCP